MRNILKVRNLKYEKYVACEYVFSIGNILTIGNIWNIGNTLNTANRADGRGRLNTIFAMKNLVNSGNIVEKRRRH